MTQPTKGARGIDISLWQPKVNWPKTATDTKFVYIKATQGIRADPLFISHWRGANSAGVPRGAYHFFTTETPPELQARAFCETIAMQVLGWGELSLMVDVEKYKNMRHVGKESYTAALKLCLDTIEKITGQVPGIYTSASMWQELTTCPAWASRHPLWAANWFALKPKLPKGWSDYLLWQTGQWLIKGISGAVDVNTWNGE